MIIRRRHTANFTTISNRLFDDERLAADEVGILAYLLSRPHDWEVRRPALQRRWGVGREAMKRVITSWIRTGWCLPSRVRLPNGTTFVIYDIRDLPGPELTDEEIRRALSLESSGAASEDSEVIRTGEEVSETGDPPTGYPSLADPPPAEPYVAYIEDKPNTDLPRDESYQNSERELARAREKHALTLADFKRRYPTAASDDQAKIDEAWFALEFDEGEAALAGIVPFVAKLKRDKRSHVPAAWKYLKEKRWTLLEAEKSASGAATLHPAGSEEAKAIVALYRIAQGGGTLPRLWQRTDGSVDFRHAIAPQLLALAQAPDKENWAILDHKQGGAWEALIAPYFAEGVLRHRCREGSRAPWPWPPRKDGTLSATGPPQSLMSEQDLAEDFR